MAALQFSSLVLVAFFVIINSESAVKDSDYQYDTLTGNHSIIEIDDLDTPAYHTQYSEPKLGNTTLRKCFCGLNEIWNGTACESQGTLVMMLYHHSNITVPGKLNTTAFENVIIREVVCPKGAKLLNVSARPVHQRKLFVLDSGELQFEDIVFENYCVEHTYNATDDRNEWFAQICVEPPAVPRCCPAGHSVGVNGSCVISGDYIFSPPIWIGHYKSLAWHAESDGAVVDVSCTEPEEMSLLELNDATELMEYQWTKSQRSSVPLLFIKGQPVELDYCIGVKAASEREPNYIVKFCYRDPIKDHMEKCRDKTCVRKCCKDSEFYNSADKSCTPTIGMETFGHKLQFHDASYNTIESKPSDITIIHGFPLCESVFKLQPHKEKYHEFFLLQNGYLGGDGFPYPYPPTDYCLESFLEEDDKVRMMPLVCFGKETNCHRVQNYLYPILHVITAGFLGITLLVYIFVPELRAKVHGKCLLSHVSALLIAYVSLFVIQLATKSLHAIACKFMASLLHFSFLAAFFWLNVMCFDIWWTLKSMQPGPESDSGRRMKLRFRLYSLYAWGCPLVINIVSVIIDFLPEDIDVYRPGLGVKKCFFSGDRAAKWIYFYGVILVLIVINAFFFCQVAHIIIVQLNNPILQRTRQQNRERMCLYVKLFFVMGITWLAEVISWHEGSCEGWILTDIVNALQGVFIFFIFIYQKNFISKVRNKTEPYLRHVKEAVGRMRFCPARMMMSSSETANTTKEQRSCSSSSDRSSRSASSQSTDQSHISSDPSASRNGSTGLMNSSTGVEVLTQNSISMGTIMESTNPGGGGPGQALQGSLERPTDALTEGKKGNKIKIQMMNGGIKKIQDSKREEEEVSDAIESHDSCDVNTDVQTSSKTVNKDNPEKADGEPLGDDEKESESVKYGESPVSNGDDSQPKGNGEEEKLEVAITISTVPMPNPMESDDVGDNQSYCLVRDDQSFKVGEDNMAVQI